MSSKARKRHERGMQMAEAITERTGKKIERSISRGRNVSRRAKGWDEINKEAEASGVKLVDVEGAEPEGDKDWETDEDMAADAPAAPATAGAEAEKPVDDNGYIAIDEDEEIL